MSILTLALFERLGLLLVLAFMLTRMSSFRSLLDRELNRGTTFMYAVIFGLFGIAGSQAGVVMEGDQFTTSFWVFSLAEDQMLVGSSLVAIVIAGLLGGPIVGFGAGLVAGVYLFFLGGLGYLANSIVNPLTGLLAGLTARFFSQERVIVPTKALFIGIFPPILQMGLLLIFTAQPEEMISLVNHIGLPLVISNSVAIAVFTAMIRVALHEQEQEAAMETQRALTIAEKALPFLKKESQEEMAEGIADLLYQELHVAAVSVTNQTEVLAHRGLGEDHHRRGDPLQSHLVQQALQSGSLYLAYSEEEIPCEDINCPLQAAIIVPMMQSGEVTGLILLYFAKSHHLSAVEVALAKGLGKLISNQLSAVTAEKMRQLIRDAELRNLQAQINPHFLFNTLHLIAALIRVDPLLGRHITVQLGNYMRFNLRLASASLVPLEEEYEHIKAYLEIVRVRFSDRLNITSKMDEGINHLLLPPSTIQPLVENSIQHGLRDAVQGGEVEIYIKKVENGALVIVQDNGVGFPSHLLKQVGLKPVKSDQGGGIGLYNVNQRLLRLLGEKAQLKVVNRRAGGCVVMFEIPAQVPKEREIGEYSGHDCRG